MKQEQQKQLKPGDLVETLFGDHLGIILTDRVSGRKKDFYIVHLFDKNKDIMMNIDRLRKVS